MSHAVERARLVEPLPERGLGGGRVEPSLMLSLGNPPNERAGRAYPQRLDFFRPKPGAEGQYADMAREFCRAYDVQYHLGDAVSGPTELPVRFPGRTVSDVLDVRLLAFGKDRLAARGVTNYAEHPEAYGKPEQVDVYPLKGDPVRVTISGPSDPFCMGGEYDIPEVWQGRGDAREQKPAVTLVATLTFILAELGSFTTPCAVSTGSLKTIERIRQKLVMVEATGAMGEWIMRLRVKPVRTAYRDPKTKQRHVSVMHQLDLDGPIKSLTDPTPLTIDEVRAELSTFASRGLLASGTNAQAASIARPLPPTSSAPYPPALEARNAAGEDDGEAVSGEVVHNPDDDIPFGSDDG